MFQDTSGWCVYLNLSSTLQQQNAATSLFCAEQLQQPWVQLITAATHDERQ